MDKILGFYHKRFKFLSNFYPSIVSILSFEKHIEFPTVENAFQAAKCQNLSDVMQFTNLTPKQAKKLGRKIILRDNWDNLKVQIMINLIKQKFEHSNLQQLLLNTGDAYLEETNWWNDTFWGVCRGEGKNMLGKIIMKCREKIKLRL